jgi:hypothetical protein
MYKLRTTFGMTYQPIHSWKKWEMDDAFMEFVWGKNPRTLIVKIADIECIEGV